MYKSKHKGAEIKKMAKNFQYVRFIKPGLGSGFTVTVDRIAGTSLRRAFCTPTIAAACMDKCRMVICQRALFSIVQ